MIGGGVLVRSSARFQNPRLVVLRVAWKEKVLEERRLAADISLAMVMSSKISPEPEPSLGPAVAGRMHGDEAAVAGCEPVAQMLLALSLSRTWRITSASRDTSVSIGAASSCNAARMRWKILGLGFGKC